MFPPVVGVHGFGYAPGEPGSDPREDLWPAWRALVHPQPFIRFGWYSYPFGPRHLWRAWRSGRWNRYYAAWDETRAAAERLADLVERTGPCAVVAHSLGTRVALLALEGRPDLPVVRLALLSGADTVEHALEVGPQLRCRVTNFVVPRDDVLGLLGRTFTPRLGFEDTIGRHRLAGRVGPHWRDEVLRNADDHWDVYRDERYHPLIRLAVRY